MKKNLEINRDSTLPPQKSRTILILMIGITGLLLIIVISVLTHVGGIIIGIIGIYKTGMVKLSWLRALVGLAALQQLCRWITPEKENVNLAFRVHEGWEKLFPSYGWHLVVLLFLTGIIFLVMEYILKKIGRTRGKKGTGKLFSCIERKKIIIVLK